MIFSCDETNLEVTSEQEEILIITDPQVMNHDGAFTFRYIQGKLIQHKTMLILNVQTPEHRCHVHHLQHGYQDARIVLSEEFRTKEASLRSLL
jgi:hypothetical protein